MGIMIIPFVSSLSDDVINSVPQSLRDGSLAIGATQSETIKRVIIPAALPGIVGAFLLALSRAVGETAPVIAISALVYLRFVPDGPLSRFTVLPIQIYNWVSRPQEDFRGLAAGGIIILLTLLLSMNSIAIFLRNKYQRESEE